MTGVKAPAGVLGASVILTHAKVPAGAAFGAHVAAQTLPFTGAALSIYLAFGVSLVLSGVALRTFGKARA
ncbi:MAG TPA: hypothetical protein VIL77_04120 [Gaiellaceae bacterium]